MQMSYPDDETVTFDLTVDERLILEKALTVLPSLLDKLRLGVRRDNRIEFTLTVDDFEDLLDALAAEANHASPIQLRRQFSRLYDRLAPLALPSPEQVADAFSHFLPPELCEGIKQLLETPGQNPETIVAEMDRLIDATAKMPRPDFDNLSLEQAGRLVDSDWKSPDSLIQLKDDLPLSGLEKALFFNNTRRILNAVAGAGRVKSTAIGNFNRDFVAQMLNVLQLPRIYVEVILPHFNVMNESHVRPLHILRVVAGLAGLIRLEKGYYHVTAKEMRLLKEPKAGELFVLLFKTFFRKFELSYLDRMVELPELQDTLVYALYVISRHAHYWQDFKEFSKRLFLPAIAAQIPVGYYGNDYTGSMAISRIYRPLEGFGLIEFQDQDKGPYSEIRAIRKTPLFDQFISFRL